MPAPARTARVVVRGGGETATAAARLLFLAGFPVAVLEREAPLAVRRLVSFAEAVFSGAVEVAGVAAQRVEPGLLPEALGEGRFVPVAVDPEAAALEALRPAVLVDGRMCKAAGAPQLRAAGLVIGLGPGFVAGRDVHVVVETLRGPGLGRLVWSGAAEADSGTPAPVAGYSAERVLRAPRAGRFRSRRAIGELVAAGEAVGEVGGALVHASIGGLLRGLVHDGVELAEGVKLGDVDPRGAAIDPRAISDKGRAVAAGVLEAVLLRSR